MDKGRLILSLCGSIDRFPVVAHVQCAVRRVDALCLRFYDTIIITVSPHSNKLAMRLMCSLPNVSTKLLNVYATRLWQLPVSYTHLTLPTNREV